MTTTTLDPTGTYTFTIASEPTRDAQRKTIKRLMEMQPKVQKGLAMLSKRRATTDNDPRRRAGALSEAETKLLWTKLRLVCRQAMRVIATDWNTPPDTWLFNHRWKDGGTCPCGAPLVRETVGGRTSCWCPTCQES